MMNDKMMENNQVMISGEVVSDYTFSHEVFGEGFYIVEVAVRRLSGAADIIPLMVSDRMLDITESCKGKYISVNGQYRSYNQKSAVKNKLVLTIFAREIEILDKPLDQDVNCIILEGFTCKDPVYRKTPLGREIADILIAVNRSYGKSDYVPCICWGRNASFASKLKVGSNIKITGRIQSRAYQKKISDTEYEDKVAYEISTNLIERLDQ